MVGIWLPISMQVEVHDVSAEGRQQVAYIQSRGHYSTQHRYTRGTWAISELMTDTMYAIRCPVRDAQFEGAILLTRAVRFQRHFESLEALKQWGSAHVPVVLCPTIEAACMMVGLGVTLRSVVHRVGDSDPSLHPSRPFTFDPEV